MEFEETARAPPVRLVPSSQPLSHHRAVSLKLLHRSLQFLASTHPPTPPEVFRHVPKLNIFRKSSNDTRCAADVPIRVKKMYCPLGIFHPLIFPLSEDTAATIPTVSCDTLCHSEAQIGSYDVRWLRGTVKRALCCTVLFCSQQ
uniref:Uncharacterized protein n=1 Tax=Sphaerodactylus townsendi TaxID=933632 RepID=A0ACB8EE44_9SAUR